MRSAVAGPEEANGRLDVVLARLGGISRARAQKLIEEGAALLDGRRRPKDHPVHRGQTLTWPDDADARPPDAELHAQVIDVAVVYEDDHLLVIDKPAGLVVHPAPGHADGTLVNALLSRGISGGHARRPGIVHRLDRDTSGLMVVARTEAAYQQLVADMAARNIERTYTALVVGSLPQDEGTIDAPMGRHLRDRKRMSLHTTSPRRAVTHFVVTRRYDGYTLIDVRLETGRTHQIRVHFAALGYPVAGDAVYGRRPRPPGLDRQFLHARRLALPHPSERERRLVFDSPLPPDLGTFLASLDPGGPS